MNSKRSFASDNNSGVHPAILNALSLANSGHVVGYGADPYTKSAIKKFKEYFGQDIDAYFVYGGTPANVLGLSTVVKPYNSIICASTAHLNEDECGAPEKYIGCKVLELPTNDGKITVEVIKNRLHGLGDEHKSQPKVISITQATEYGTVYTPQEIKKIADFAHKNNLYFHVDGARIANAAVFLKKSLKEITAGVGIDILSFGGTKNGMMYGEAVIFFNTNVSKEFKYIRKQGMQLASKMRYISVQFETLLSNNLWYKNADNANKMAAYLASELTKLNIKITQKVEANAVFAILSKKIIPVLQKEYFFYVWNEEKSEVRLMTSFDTTEKDVKNFIETLRKKF